MGKQAVNKIELSDVCWVEIYDDGSAAIYQQSFKTITGIELTAQEKQAFIEAINSNIKI